MHLPEQVEESLREVASAIDQVDRKAEEIATASEQQSVTSEQIARSVESISTVAQGSAAGVTEVSDVAANLDALTEKLETRLHQFELGDDRSPIEAESAHLDGQGLENERRAHVTPAEAGRGASTVQARKESLPATPSSHVRVGIW